MFITKYVSLIKSISQQQTRNRTKLDIGQRPTEQMHTCSMKHE